MLAFFYTHSSAIRPVSCTHQPCFVHWARYRWVPLPPREITEFGSGPVAIATVYPRVFQDVIRVVWGLYGADELYILIVVYYNLPSPHNIMILPNPRRIHIECKNDNSAYVIFLIYILAMYEDFYAQCVITVIDKLSLSHNDLFMRRHMSVRWVLLGVYSAIFTYAHFLPETTQHDYEVLWRV